MTSWINDKLIQRCKSELPYVTTAFEELLRQYEPIVFRACNRYLRNEQEAEEVCQDVFLRVFHGLARFEGRSSFRSWLFQIVRNACATRFARRQKTAKLATSLPDACLADVPDEKACQSTTAGDLRGVVGEGLELLSPNDQQILVLRHVSELSLGDVSKALGVGLSATKMRLYRAEERLRAAYNQAVTE